METTIENVSRPGQEPQERDWLRTTTRDANGAVLSVVEEEYHVPVMPGGV